MAVIFPDGVDSPNGPSSAVRRSFSNCRRRRSFSLRMRSTCSLSFPFLRYPLPTANRLRKNPGGASRTRTENTEPAGPASSGMARGRTWAPEVYAKELTASEEVTAILEYLGKRRTHMNYGGRKNGYYIRNIPHGSRGTPVGRMTLQTNGHALAGGERRPCLRPPRTPPFHPTPLLMMCWVQQNKNALVCMTGA